MSSPGDKTKKFFNLAIVLVSILVIGVGNLLYTNHIAEQQTQDRINDGKKFCSVVNRVVGAYQTLPEPSTELGRQLKHDYLELQHELGCVDR